jgi:Legionella pneumophila major outer membrane protein precursor
MFARSTRLVAAILGVILSAEAAFAQDVIPREYVGPLSHPRYDDDGVYGALEFLFMKQTDTIHSQAVAVRGFTDVTGAVSGAPGTFIGDGSEALNTEQLRGNNLFTPGFDLTLGYRFKDGFAIQASWWHLANASYSATAGPIPPSGNLGANLENTFLSSPVSNLPPNFAGPPNDVIIPGSVSAANPTGIPALGAGFGVFNAASAMVIQFTQRYDMVEVQGRVPIMETDNYRSYGLFGPRTVIMYERFYWQTTDLAADGTDNNFWDARYTNTVSNRLYGVFVGSGNEFRLGDSPVGTFSFYCEADAAIYVDFVKMRAEYELDDRSVLVRRGRNTYTAPPGCDLRLGFNWYPYEAIELRLGYRVQALFFTASSPEPIDFNAGSVNPGLRLDTFRLIQGIDAGISFVF